MDSSLTLISETVTPLSSAFRIRTRPDDCWIKRDLNVDDALEHFLNSVGSKVKVRRPEAPKRAVYRRRRTRYGSPAINRRSYTDEDLLRFERDNDGFPLAASEDELREFDDEVFSGDTLRKAGDSRVAVGGDGVEVKSKSRSKSLSEVAALTKLLKLPHVSAPSKPKFLNRLITGVGLNRKCSGNTKKAGTALLDNQETSTDLGSFSEDEVELASSPSVEHDGAVGYLQLLHDSDHGATAECYGDLTEPVAHKSQGEACSPPTSPILPGFVKHRCRNFQRLSEERELHLARARLHHRARSEDRTTSDSPRSRRACFSPVAEKADRWVKNFYSLSRDKDFSKAVMAKGYVRALAEQINSGALQPHDDDENDDAHHGGGDVGEKASVASGQKNGHSQGCTPTRDIQEEDVNVGEVTKCTCPADVPPHSPTSASGSHSQCSSPTRTGKLGRSQSEGACKVAMSPGLHRKGSGDTHSPRPIRSSKDRQRQGSKSPCSLNPKAKAVSPGPKSPKSPGKFSRHKPPVDYAHKPKVSSSLKVPIGSSTMGGDSPTPSNKSHSLPAQSAAEENSDSHAQHSELQPVSNAVSVASDSNGNRKYVAPSGMYDNVFQDPSLTPQELFDMSWSDSDSDEFTDDSEVEEEAIQSGQQVEQLSEAPPSATPQDKLRKIADEFLMTERTYVQRLSLLHQVFYFRIDKENRQHGFLPSDVLNQMFSSIQSIHQFHNDFLLRELEARMENWESERRIGDLMKKNAPFLKLYTAYVKNFDHAMNLINTWQEKSVKFKAIIHEIQKMPECGCLTLQHHMLEPIQRVPRYELLLKDYIKHLPVDSPDKQDAQDALDLVTKAASHSNEAMKKIEKFHKLLDIYQRLRGVAVDFISPTRDFVREGPITKISARSGEKQSRYLFLFNDLLLICSEPLMGAFKVRAELDVDGMEVKNGDNLAIPNTFLVHSKQKAIELLDEQSRSGENGWLELLRQVIEDYRSRKRSLRNDTITQDTASPTEEHIPGKHAPRWIPDDNATMCMVCQQTFTTFRRRHHCRACGHLICKACSKKAPLAYMNNRMERVCIKCHDVIVYSGRSPAQSPTGDTSPKKKGVLQIKADDPGLLSGYLQVSEDNGKTWCKRWFTLRDDFVMYFFRARKDVSAYHSLPLPGYTVETVTDADKPYTFRVHHKNQKVTPILFQAENEKLSKKWVNFVGKLTLLQLPDDSQRLSSQSNSSTGSNNSDTTSANNNNNCSSSNSDKLSQADSGCPPDSVCGDSVTDGICSMGEDGADSATESAAEKL